MSENKTFNVLPLPKDILKNLESLGFLEMTPIQEKSLPFILDKKDIIAQAKTGSGKTAAFGLGILSTLNVTSTEPHAMVLCPTRELAEQVSKELRRLARGMSNIKILTLSGGSPEHIQQQSLKHGAHIVVGTPGRVQKMILKKALVLRAIKIFVLDEADRMLDMGFSKDIHAIAADLPKQRQTLLFSATYPEEIQDMSQNLQKKPIEVKVDAKHEENVIRQLLFQVDGHKNKIDALTKILNHFQPESTVIFCDTKQTCKEIASYLKNKNISALAIHGDLEQKDRTLVLTQFSNKSCLILVATDVAARGLDIQELQAVINYNLPSDPEVYVHRIGRTGRAGKEGLALTIFTDREKSHVDMIENYCGNTFHYEKIDKLDTAKKFDGQPKFTTISILGGRKDSLRPGDILGALTGVGGIPGASVGKIDIFDIQSYVAVESRRIDAALDCLQSSKIKGRRFRISRV